MYFEVVVYLGGMVLCDSDLLRLEDDCQRIRTHEFVAARLVPHLVSTVHFCLVVFTHHIALVGPQRDIRSPQHSAKK